MMALVFFLLIVYAVTLVGVMFAFAKEKHSVVAQPNDTAYLKQQHDDIYAKPTFVVLTQEQIDTIHARGSLTPQEQVREWESMDLCAPGDMAGSTSKRCKKFHHNCHDCLVDYSNRQAEYLPIDIRPHMPYNDV